MPFTPSFKRILSLLITALVIISATASESIAQSKKAKPKPKPKKKKVVQTFQPTSHLEAHHNKDTLYFRFKTGEVSVKVPPLVDGRRTIRFYNKQGKEVFEFGEMRFSFSVSCEYYFYENGGVRHIIGESHPDAGLYTGRSEYFFSPEQRLEKETHVELEGGAVPRYGIGSEKVYLYKPDGTRVLQETIGCQPVPGPK